MGDLQAKVYLKRIKLLDTQVEVYLRQIEELRELATSIRSSADIDDVRVQTSSGGDRLLDTIAKVEDYRVMANEAINNLIDLRAEARGYILRLEDENYIRVLSLRYLDCKNWGDIADEMAYTLSYVYKLHGWALLAFDEILKDDSK